MTRWKAACGLVSAAILAAGCGHAAVRPGGPAVGPPTAPAPSSPAPSPSAPAVTIPSPALPPPSPSVGVHSSPAATRSPSPTPVASPVSVIQQSDSGKTFTVKVGTSAQLQLPETMHWSPPQVDTPAVSVTPVTFLRDPGYLAWTVRAVAAGQARITSAGSPNCSPGMACPMYVIEFRVTIQVSPA
ncbi:MAG TPA: hypothetical protein VFW71_13975 [Actinomycetota bacterium]|nr:hypothetical protein [Actinomycetota bacterium]